MDKLLLAALALPLLGAIAAGGDAIRARRVALATMLVGLALAAVLVCRYPIGAAQFAVTEFAWLGWTGAPIDVRFSVGLDGLSLWLFALTALLGLVAVLVSWEAIREQGGRFYRLLLVLQAGMLGVFCARDIILFYLFFEFTLIPLFFVIGIWGHEERQFAAMKFFLFTLAGSLLTFLGLLTIVLWDHYLTPGGPLTFSIPQLTQDLAARPLPQSVQLWVFLALFAGFAIKVPLFPLHTWLPLAHVQAPTAGSVILAGLMLKLGGYGFLRFSVPLLPDAAVQCMPWLLGLSVTGILYGALVALAQRDMKRLVAYSSVSHLGFCLLGIFALNRAGLAGGSLQMINHGLSTGGLFALVGMIYDRYHTRQIADFGGLARRLPWLAFFMVVMTLSSIGLPGLNGFAGEFLLLLGMFQRAWGGTVQPYGTCLQVISVLAVFGVVVGAWYMLQLVRRVFFGPLREPPHGDHPPVRDLSLREILALAPLVVFIVWIGVQPRVFLDRMIPTIDSLTSRAQQVAEGTGVRGQGSGVRDGNGTGALSGHRPEVGRARETTGQGDPPIDSAGPSPCLPFSLSPGLDSGDRS
jgi:NADH-quinone oxidoreductase subunit M